MAMNGDVRIARLTRRLGWRELACSAFAMLMLLTLSACGVGGTGTQTGTQDGGAGTTGTADGADPSSGQTWIDYEGEETTELPIVFYYDGICAACETEAEFRTLLDRELRGFQQGTYRYRGIDGFQVGDWKESLVDYTDDVSKLVLPVLRIGNRLIEGEAAIEASLRLGVHEELGLPYKVYTYYYRPDCPDCVEIVDEYEAWKSQTGIIVEEANVKEEAQLDTIRSLFDDLELEQDLRQIPFFIEYETMDYWTIDRVSELLTEKP